MASLSPCSRWKTCCWSLTRGRTARLSLLPPTPSHTSPSSSIPILSPISPGDPHTLTHLPIQPQYSFTHSRPQPPHACKPRPHSHPNLLHSPSHTSPAGPNFLRTPQAAHFYLPLTALYLTPISHLLPILPLWQVFPRSPPLTPLPPIAPSHYTPPSHSPSSLLSPLLPAIPPPPSHPPSSLPSPPPPSPPPPQHLPRPPTGALSPPTGWSSTAAAPTTLRHGRCQPA